MSGRWLLRQCALVATFDDAEREYRDADVLVDGHLIVAVGKGLDSTGCDRVIDGTGLVVIPGLVNAHQHLYQGALRAIPHLERALIGPWLRELGAIVKAWWQAGRFEPDAVGAIAAAVLTESMLSGVTTVADQHYFHPAGATQPYIEETIDAARRVGVRLHACRGSLTLGPDASVVQSVDEVVRHSAALIDAFHDPSAGAFVRVALAPCGVHVDELALFDELAALAADYDGVRLHTHLYERVDTEAARDRYGMTPWELLVSHGWAQPRTWLAHVVDVPTAEIDEIAAAGVGVAHLIAPDLRMGWGVAPVREMLDAGVTVGFGTTGSAS
ncbi:MAG: trzN, partial [Actinomycetia bacterium]|nr:trzN [Actinomycetes bacterium]